MTTVRLATPEDLPRLWDIVQRAIVGMLAEGNPQWGKDYPTHIAYEEDIERGELWAAIDDNGTLIGVAAITHRPEPSYAPIAWSYPDHSLAIHRVAIDPEVQRKGAASVLFAQAEHLAREKNLPALRIDTYAMNKRMRALIAKQGFTPMGEISLLGRDRPDSYLAFEKVLG